MSRVAGLAGSRCRSTAVKRATATSIASARRAARSRGQEPSRAGSSPACRSPGASARATRTWAAIIWSGRATWWRRPAACWPPARTTRRAASSPICASSRRPTAIGRRTCGSTARPTGTACRWTRRAFPILLVDRLARRRALAPLDSDDLSRLWPMVQKAAGLSGAQRPGDPRRTAGKRTPATRRSRWRSEIAALLAAADIADQAASRGAADLPARDGRTWNDQHRALDLRDRHRTGAQRSASKATTCASRRRRRPMRRRRRHGFVPIKNRPPEQMRSGRRRYIVSPDALALVRFGLRAADDPRIVNTVQGHRRGAAKWRRRNGPAWRRYNGDGYGEHEDGAPFDGTGHRARLAAADRRARPL